MRIALAVVVPFAFLLPLVAYDAAKVLFGYGATATTFDHYVPSMILFGPGVVFFTVHYLMLRGFYALEQNRTVFFVQCAIAATNVVVAVVLVSRATPAQTSPALVVAYLSSYVLGATASYLILRSRLGGLQTPHLVRFVVRLLIAATVSTAVAWGVGLVLPGAGHDVTPPLGRHPAGRAGRRRRRRLPAHGTGDAAQRGHHRGGHVGSSVPRGETLLGLGRGQPEGERVPEHTRPGDVLADRYRLTDLLTESGGGRFWRAFDSVLQRDVAVHIIACDDERAPAAA